MGRWIRLFPEGDTSQRGRSPFRIPIARFAAAQGALHTPASVTV